MYCLLLAVIVWCFCETLYTSHRHLSAIVTEHLPPLDLPPEITAAAPGFRVKYTV